MTLVRIASDLVDLRLVVQGSANGITLYHEDDRLRRYWCRHLRRFEASQQLNVNLVPDIAIRASKSPTELRSVDAPAARKSEDSQIHQRPKSIHWRLRR